MSRILVRSKARQENDVNKMGELNEGGGKGVDILTTLVPTRTGETENNCKRQMPQKIIKIGS